MAVIAGDVDNRQRYAGGLELLPQLDAGFVVQIDIENDAAGRAEITVISQCLS